MSVHNGYKVGMTGKLWWVWIVPILLVIVSLAVNRLTFDLFWLDEEITLYLTGGSIYGPLESTRVIFERMESIERWPPLYHVMMSVWGGFTGWTELAVRYFSLLFGALAVAVVYRFGADVHSKQAGIFAGTILAFSAFFAHYLHEARAYTLAVFLVALSGWLYWRLAHMMPRLRFYRSAVWVLFPISAVATLYVHYIAGLTIITLGLYHLVIMYRAAVDNRRRWWIILGVLIACGVAFLPWTAIAVQSVSDELADNRSLSLASVVFGILQGFGNGLGLLGIPLVLLISVRLLPQDRTVRFIWWWGFVSFALALLVNVVLNYLVSVRHLIHLLVPLSLLGGVILAWVSQYWRYAGVAGLLVWIIAGLLGYRVVDFIGTGHSLGLPVDTWTQTQSIFNGCVAPEDALVFHYRDDRYGVTTENEWKVTNTLRYYNRLLGEPNPYAQLYEMVNLQNQGGWPNPIPDIPYDERVQNFVGDVPRVWLFASPDPNEEALATFAGILSEKYSACEGIVATDDLVVNLYTREDFTCEVGDDVESVVHSC